MSMDFSVYVGPFMTVPKDFDWLPWGMLVADGRMEAGNEDDLTYLIPNQALEGVSREMRYDRFGDYPVFSIDGNSSKETRVFISGVEQLTSHCRVLGIEYSFYWGAVPCWS